MTSDPSRSVSACLLKDPGVGFIECQLHEWDVVAVESCRFIPDLAPAKQADDGHRVTHSRMRSFTPDADSDHSLAEFVNG